ncbi:hypothetical protein Tcan_08815 [Toxocara canis]|uniref:Uncharacterized protein n=1 Tax=Toxocara canis TaxID=6265 RepID=A0A0B2URR7_TOXCA|nr:hypothetical protein Tcan_08815 [Toxocara canis]
MAEFLGKMTEKIEQKFAQALRLDTHDRPSVPVAAIPAICHGWYNDLTRIADLLKNV